MESIFTAPVESNTKWRSKRLKIYKTLREAGKRAESIRNMSVLAFVLVEGENSDKYTVVKLYPEPKLSDEDFKRLSFVFRQLEEEDNFGEDD